MEIEDKRKYKLFNRDYFDEVFVITYRLLERILEYYEMNNDIEKCEMCDEKISSSMKSICEKRNCGQLVRELNFVEEMFCEIEKTNEDFRVRDGSRFERLDKIFKDVV